MDLLINKKEEKKSSIKKEKGYFLTDVETCNKRGKLKIIMEWSFIVVNDFICKKQEKCYIIKEVWENEEYRNGEFAKGKLEHWQELIDSGKAKVISIYKLYDIVNKTIKENGLKLFCAYNADFDFRAIHQTYHRFGIDKRADFEETNEIGKMEKFCLMNYAEKIFKTKDYIKWAKKNALTPKGNIQTSAEACYRYLSENTCFAESHYGIEDLQIEYTIFLASMIRNATDRNNTLILNKNGHWNLITQYAKELEMKGLV